MKYIISFIGAGNMGSALAAAACKTVGPDRIIVTNRSLEKAKSLADRLGCHLAPNNLDAARDANFVMLGVKPQDIHQVTKELTPVLTGNQVLVTMAAGVAIDSLARCLDKPVPIIRILPNTPCAIGHGLILISASEKDKKHVSWLMDILKAAGSFQVIPESLMDSGCVAAGCSPAYAYMFIDAIAKGTQAVGLPYAIGLTCAANAVLGAAAMILETGKNPEELKNAVCSPGGSTIEGARVLEEGGLYNIVARAAEASYRRNIQLGKENE
ncbi:MAG TPA: pyrroline-5-carboxylate reductase [Clostridiales bacterium]|nr:pyrroline-5-carboxylate reductase [Clostridiales bacterium]